MMNISKGNMYPWVSHTWNPIKGKCPHDCSYCYMKRFPQKELRLDEKALLDDLGKGNFIFVGSSTDMWAEGVPDEWIHKVIVKCQEYKDNTFLFQTKNTARFRAFEYLFRPNFVLGTTIESDIAEVGNAPKPSLRSHWLNVIGNDQESGISHMMVSIEPVMKFNRDEMLKLIGDIFPKFVSIGADTGNCHLPEPSKVDLEWLITEMRKFTEVKVKDNLKRLMV